MRLTNQHRAEMIARCVAATFKAPREAYEAARTAFANKLYDHAFGSVEELANKLPAGWLARKSEIEVSGEGFVRWASDAEEKCPRMFKLGTTKPFPSLIGSAFHIREDHPMYEDAQVILRHDAKLKADILELEQGLQGLLASVTTLAKLKEVWPEGEKFFPVELPKVHAVIPYGLTLKINRMMQGVLA